MYCQEGKGQEAKSANAKICSENGYHVLNGHLTLEQAFLFLFFWHPCTGEDERFQKRWSLPQRPPKPEKEQPEEFELQLVWQCLTFVKPGKAVKDFFGPERAEAVLMGLVTSSSCVLRGFFFHVKSCWEWISKLLGNG